jgi:hypothetical protein
MSEIPPALALDLLEGRFREVRYIEPLRQVLSTVLQWGRETSIGVYTCAWGKMMCCLLNAEGKSPV